jgi:hypothetical protein
VRVGYDDTTVAVLATACVNVDVTVLATVELETMYALNWTVTELRPVPP